MKLCNVIIPLAAPLTEFTNRLRWLVERRRCGRKPVVSRRISSHDTGATVKLSTWHRSAGDRWQAASTHRTSGVSRSSPMIHVSECF